MTDTAASWLDHYAHHTEQIIIIIICKRNRFASFFLRYTKDLLIAAKAGILGSNFAH